MKVIPTLDLAGWVSSPEERIDRILLYYTCTNPSQTLRYKGQVVSLQHAIFQAGDDMIMLSRIMAKELTAVFSRNFPDGATVTVDANAIDDSGRYDMEIMINVADNNRQYNAAHTLIDIKSEYVSMQNVTVKRG